MSRSGVRLEIPIGSRFGKWTVTGPPEPTGIYGVYAWPCRCECGRQKSIHGATLRNGASSKCKSCAAKKRKPYRDISGERFGRWVVVRRLEPSERKNYYDAWLCRCDCGTERGLSSSDFRNSQGCRKCRAKENPSCRIRPYESVFRAARSAIINRIGRKRIYEFTISYEDFASIAETGKCHYCHAVLIWARFNSSKNSAYRLDRKDNALGYVPGNVVGCCKRCNYSKGANYSYEEWYRMTECFRNGMFVPHGCIGSGFGSPLSRPR